MPKFFLVDDDARVRHVISMMLSNRPDWEVCGKAAEGQVTAEVRDNGTGMSAERLTQILSGGSGVGIRGIARTHSPIPGLPRNRLRPHRHPSLSRNPHPRRSRSHRPELKATV